MGCSQRAHWDPGERSFASNVGMIHGGRQWLDDGRLLLLKRRLRFGLGCFRGVWALSSMCTKTKHGTRH